MASLDKKYVLSYGSRVREEDFGLLFYTMAGPRLYFLFSGSLMDASFFQGKVTLKQYLGMRSMNTSEDSTRLRELIQGLERLRQKGVIVEQS